MIYNDFQIVDAQLNVFRASVAMAIAARKVTEQKYNLAELEVNKWLRRVQLATQKDNEYLANIAWKQVQSAVATTNMLKNQLAEQTIHVENLKCRLSTWENKIAKVEIQNGVKPLNTNSVIVAFEQMEEKILMQEAREELINDDIVSKVIFHHLMLNELI